MPRCLKTLYFTERPWWLSQRKYQSVWVGFLYTEDSNVLSGPGETRVSRNRIHPLLLGTSVVNCICGSVELICLLDDKGVINIPKPKYRWIRGSADGFGFQLLHEQLATMGLMEKPMVVLWICSKYLPV